MLLTTVFKGVKSRRIGQTKNIMKHVYQGKLHVYCSGCLQEYGKPKVTLSELKELGFTEVNSISFNSVGDGYTVTVVIDTEGDEVSVVHYMQRLARCRLAKPCRSEVESIVQLS